MPSIYDNHQAEKEKKNWETKKIEKFSQRNIYVRIAYYFVCVGGVYICVLFCVFVYVILVPVCKMIDTLNSKSELVSWIYI